MPGWRSLLSVVSLCWQEQHRLCDGEQTLGCACHFEHKPIPAALLNRLTALDAKFGRRIDDGPGRAAFIKRSSQMTMLASGRTIRRGATKCHMHCSERVVRSNISKYR
jgi:hypothetical protein